MLKRYANARGALSFAHTGSTPSRFNEGLGSFSTLYLGEDHLVALFEVQALLGSPYATWVPAPRQNWTIVNVAVALQSVVDLTLPRHQARLATTAQELTGDWRANHLRSTSTSVSQPAGVPAPTQELGAALYSTRGVEGFTAISAKVPTHQILVVFPDRLLAGSRLECRDDKGKLLYKLRPEGSRERRS